MNLINTTGMPARYTMGLEPDGRELLVVVVKGTFTIPTKGREPRFAPEQAPLVEADLFTGEPGLSAVLHGSDYPPVKPRCDVLVNGSAYAPRGEPAERVTVSLRVGSCHKSFDVVGNRKWKKGVLLTAPTDPKPFTVMPISYDNAFGGVDRALDDPTKHRWHPSNPAGVGYHEYLDAEFVDGKPLPNTEETGRRVIDPRGKYKPMAFGPVGRSWPSRVAYAGTYDENWLENVCPFLPSDFDPRYYQSAPEDQQIDHIAGGERAELSNLTPEGKTVFELPRLDVPVEFSGSNFCETKTAACDTVILEPDAKRCTLVWRATIPLKRNIFEVHQVIVGRMSRGWYRARRTKKTFYPNLRDLARHWQEVS